MKIIISNSSPVPIYEQIKNAFIEGITSGDLQAGDGLPSIRVLARDINISVMTIKKAYDALETEGYITSIQGKGSFVASINSELKCEMARRKIEEHIEQIVDISNRYKIKKEEIFAIFEIFYGRDE